MKFLNFITLVLFVASLPAFAQSTPSAAETPRPPRNEADLKFWLENMVGYHGYSIAEVSAATGLSEEKAKAEIDRLKLSGFTLPKRSQDDPLLLLPYPGGRHPRIGFLDGAINPQRETKMSIFTPWDSSSYVVVDVPEAIFSTAGLQYLAHHHPPNVPLYERAGLKLEPLEWERKNNTLELIRELPNKVTFHTKVVATKDAVEMELSLTNGTPETISKIRVQNCVMFKGAKGFEAQTNENKIKDGNIVACKSGDGRRWIITAWNHCKGGTWLNPPCPCMHSDPQIPDCEPGQTQKVQGWLAFYEGDDIKSEIVRLRTKYGE